MMDFLLGVPGKLKQILDSIATRAAAATALSNAVWTDARAAVLDKLGYPIGSPIAMWGAGLNPTVFGIEWLRTGVMRPIAGYTGLLTTNPGLCYNVVTQANSAAGTTASNHTMRYLSGGYYRLGGGVVPWWAASLTGTWAAVTSGSATSCNDAYTQGGVITHLTNGTAHFYLQSGGTGGISGAAALQYYSGAVNGAGTQSVIGSLTTGTAGNICTSPDGVNFTQRTPTGGVTGLKTYFTVGQKVVATYAYLCDTGRVQTSPDGYTLTDRGIPTNLGAVAQGVCAASDYCCASSTVTLFSVIATYNGVANTPVLVRSTNGTSFTATPWETIVGFKPATAPKIDQQGGVFTAVASALLIKDNQFCFQSTDGATWTPLPVPYNTVSTQALSTWVVDIRYLNGSYLVTPDFNATNTYFTVASLAATHVGTPFEFVQANGQGPTGALFAYYVRIK